MSKDFYKLSPKWLDELLRDPNTGNIQTTTGRYFDIFLKCLRIPGELPETYKFANISTEESHESSVCQQAFKEFS